MLKRKKQGKTDYRKRLMLLKSGMIRIVVRITNKNIIVQAVKYQENGDKILAGVDSRKLINYGWKSGRKNIPAAYLTGYLLGKKLNGEVKKAVLDSGLQNARKNKVMYSALKGIIDSGINVKAEESIFPDGERIKGKHIKANIEEHFEMVKQGIENERRK